MTKQAVPRAIVARASGSGASSSTTAGYSPLDEHIRLWKGHGDCSMVG